MAVKGKAAERLKWARAWERERRAILRAALAEQDRRAAVRFLRRATRAATRLKGGRRGRIAPFLRRAELSSLHRLALWRVVVAASHKSGRFAS